MADQLFYLRQTFSFMRDRRAPKLQLPRDAEIIQRHIDNLETQSQNDRKDSKFTKPSVTECGVR